MSDLGIVSDTAVRQNMVRDDNYYRLKADIEDFFYTEADFLDNRLFKEWLDLFAEDTTYFMQIRHNVKFGQHAERENTRLGEGISWFDEGKWTLGKRIDQILTGVHYAEEPLSRVTHMVSNVQILEVRDDDEGREVDVRSRFLVYQNRVEYDTNFFVGKRTDTLRETVDGWRIARREIILDQNVLLAKSLTTFF